MEQGRNRLYFIRAVLHCDCSDSQDVRDVRNLGFLPQLPTVNSRGIEQRFLKLARESHVLAFQIGYVFNLRRIISCRRSMRPETRARRERVQSGVSKLRQIRF